MSAEESSATSLPAPWGKFLTGLNDILPHLVELHCLGGFVLWTLYGLPRPTGDLDYIAAVPNDDVQIIQELAGLDSALAKRYKIHVQYVTVPDVPDDYEMRLKEILSGCFSKLRLLALDPHDIVLSKLTRNSPRDDFDVQFLVKKGLLARAMLLEIYERELKPKLANQERHDTTLKLWLEYF